MIIFNGDEVEKLEILQKIEKNLEQFNSALINIKQRIFNSFILLLYLIICILKLKEAETLKEGLINIFYTSGIFMLCYLAGLFISYIILSVFSSKLKKELDKMIEDKKD